MAVQRDKVSASAEKLVAKGKIEPAIKEYERLLDDNPNDVNTLNRIGDLWVRINRTDEAVKVFTRIADHYSKDGFFLKAIAIYKKINKLDPSKLDIYAKLADLYAKQGLAMEAKSQYQVLADYYLKHADPAKALATYRKISELDPNSINVHVKLADLYSQNNQTAEALKEYDRIGRMLLKRGMLDEAVQVFRKALKIDASNVDLAESLANGLSEAKDYANAIQLLETSLESNQGNPRLLVLLGRTQLAKGDPKAAREALQKGLASNPSDVSIREALADVHLKLGSPDQAFQLMQPAVDAALGRGDGRAAVEMLNRVLRLDASHVPTLEKMIAVFTKLQQETNILAGMNSLAEAHIAARRFDQAATALGALIKREPENKQHKEKLAFVNQNLSGAAPAPPPHPSPARPSPPPSPVRPSPPPEDISFAPEELAEELTEADFAIDLDASDAIELDLSTESAPEIITPPSYLEPPPALPSIEEEEEDLDLITEHLTEAEVFAKYGLSDKAIEHLRAVLDRAPRNLQAHEKLLRIYMDEGDNEQVSKVGATYMSLLREKGDRAALEAIEAEASRRGFTIAAAAARPAARPLVKEETISITEEEPDVEIPLEVEEEFALEIEEEPAPEPVAGIVEEFAEPEFVPLIEETVELGEDLLVEEPAFEIPDIALEPEAPKPPPPKPPPPKPEAPKAAPPKPAPPPKPPPKPAPVPAAPAIEELGEIDFYVEQQLYDEARAKLDALARRFPADIEVESRLERVTALQVQAQEAASASLASEILTALDDQPAPAADEENLFADEDNFFDLAAELEHELGQEGDDQVSLGEEEQSLEEIFKEFKKGVEQQLDSEDYDTHYNLGIAYKEMGLIDEAIGEFQLASKDPKRVIECCSMLGLCFLEKGMPQLSIKWYKKGLENPEITEDENIGMLYDLASAHMEVGDTVTAQKTFHEVYGMRSNYRDVVEKIKQLEGVKS